MLFEDETALDTEVQFALEGTYSLRLTVDDGELVGSDDVLVDVLEAAALATIVVSPPTPAIRPGETQSFLATGYDQHGQEFAIDAEPSQAVWTDGEYLGHTPVAVKVIPGGLSVAVP